ncbi:penicillin-binding protein [bacterium]|jgi:cell division protein FtsI/penicillin-binding protein 2|nr:penicillin-binding protein [bacterium]
MRRTLKRSRYSIIALASLSVVGLVGLLGSQFFSKDDSDLVNAKQKKILADAIQTMGVAQNFPSDVEINLGGKKPIHVKLDYTFDTDLQHDMESLLKSYGPDYGSVVVLDAATGQILSMANYQKPPRKTGGNLALQSTFPSASVFKVVTAAAAIAERNVSANTLIPVNGRYHTLYKSNVLRDKINRWTRYLTLKDAFAQSVNSAFGKLGVFTVGPTELRKYAERFGFNRSIASDLPMEMGRADISDDAWSLAETASGFTRETTMSPLQGALIAAAVVNEGKMMEPYVVQSATADDGKYLYHARSRVSSVTVDPQTANEIRALMRQTVTRGTSRTSFRGFTRGALSMVDVGGKTGSLTGTEPRGKYDWFIGFAELGNRRVAVAALTIHEKYWVVKSSYLGRRAIESYFKNQRKVASSNHL